MQRWELAVGLYWINDELGRLRNLHRWITSLTGAGIGALLGWLIGESMPPDFINIRFNTPYDVTKLKDYSAYYFQYDKFLEEKYVELE